MLEELGGFVAGGILVWWICSLIKKGVIAFGIWFDAAKPMLFKLMLILLAAAAVAAVLYGIYRSVRWLLKQIERIDLKIQSIEELSINSAHSLDRLRGTVSYSRDRQDEIAQLVRALDKFTGYADHRALLAKAKAAEAQVTGKSKEDESPEDGQEVELEEEE